MRRVGKIGRQKLFPKVKDVNVESLKIGSKLLDFSQIVLNNLCHSFHPKHVENRV